MFLFQDLLWHASIIELVWIIAAIDLFFVSRQNNAEAVADRTALGEIRNGRRKLVDTNIVVARIFMFIGAGKLLIGLLATLSPANPSPSLLGMLITMFLAVMLVAADAAMRSVRNLRLYINENGLMARESETAIQKQDRIVGDKLREEQARDV